MLFIADWSYLQPPAAIKLKMSHCHATYIMLSSYLMLLSCLDKVAALFLLQRRIMTKASDLKLSR